jgi:hypothetical protein
MTAHPLGGHIEATDLSSSRVTGRCRDLPARGRGPFRHAEQGDADGGERSDGLTGATRDPGRR